MSNKKVSYTEAFEELCPFYLSIGMSYEQYWYGVPYLVEVYMKSHKLNIQRRNEELWWQGVYIKNALELPVTVLNDPVDAVAIGGSKFFNNKNLLSDMLGVKLS